jgi:hypothetical protein
VVVSLDDVGDFFGRGIETVFNEGIPEFVDIDESVVIFIEGLEGFVDVEQGSSVQFLSDFFVSGFVSDVVIEDFLDEVLGFIAESLNDKFKLQFFLPKST